MKKYIKVTVVQLIAFVFAIILLVNLGCGSDEEAPMMDEKDETVGLVGSWEVVSIDGESLDEILDPPDGFEIQVTKNEYVFATDGWWAESIGIKMVGDLGDGISLTLSFTASAKGKYTVSDSRLSSVLDEVSVKLEPQNVWEEIGITEAALEQELREDIVESGTWSVSGKTLTLTSDDGTKTVLRQK